MFRSTARSVALWAGLVGVLVLSAFAQPLLAQSPRPGDVKRQAVITLAMHVGSMESDVRRLTYSPPPGWYVRSHVVYVRSRHGNVSFGVNTLPEKWNWSSGDRVDRTREVAAEGRLEAQKIGGDLKLRHQQTGRSEEASEVRATHHAVVLEASARGEGFLRGGASLELTVVAELVYMPESTATLDANAVRLGEPIEIHPGAGDRTSGR